MAKRMKRIVFDDLWLTTGGLTKKAIKELLDQLPSDVTVTGFGRSYSYLESYMYVQSEDYAEVRESEQVPDLHIRFGKSVIYQPNIDDDSFSALDDYDYPCDCSYEGYVNHSFNCRYKND